MASSVRELLLDADRVPAFGCSLGGIGSRCGGVAAAATATVELPLLGARGSAPTRTTLVPPPEREPRWERRSFVPLDIELYQIKILLFWRKWKVNGND
jgi:hypothetical protein